MRQCAKGEELAYPMAAPGCRGPSALFFLMLFHLSRATFAGEETMKHTSMSISGLIPSTSKKGCLPVSLPPSR